MAVAGQDDLFTTDIKQLCAGILFKPHEVINTYSIKKLHVYRQVGLRMLLRFHSLQCNQPTGSPFLLCINCCSILNKRYVYGTVYGIFYTMITWIYFSWSAVSFKHACNESATVNETLEYLCCPHMPVLIPGTSSFFGNTLSLGSHTPEFDHWHLLSSTPLWLLLYIIYLYIWDWDSFWASCFLLFDIVVIWNGCFYPQHLILLRRFPYSINPDLDVFLNLPLSFTFIATVQFDLTPLGYTEHTEPLTAFNVAVYYSGTVVNVAASLYRDRRFDPRHALNPLWMLLLSMTDWWKGYGGVHGCGQMGHL